ncbi:metal-dependent hydrolase [Coraliomargarita sp. SDUM461004]|uniref:Metal-dependent hydrolase n=1 Tax=Thalassobacterium sedimentorum TaxID=3041258 RepID=A0ABU1ALS1_9BACT|nr:metal-dependent hydrolase [Coraliomargarita sp. SDUM461004]MDQ8194543.1 metal-dependent hydrolase [Coraliomargarita sp. SDUM461004]
MDPLTQASMGAAAAAWVCRKPETRHALLLGAIAGAAPDLDVLIRSDLDPLLSLEYHRHFTHALWLAPVIGLIVAALFKALFFWKHWPYHRLALFAVVGAATHGLIDACTSYGTLLYWPISTHRESWDIISIVDPIFTIPLVLLTIIAFAFRRPYFAQVAVGLCLLYLSLGIYQRSQAVGFAQALADSRGHRPEELTVRPSFANIVLWRIVYRFEGRYYVDAVRVMPLSEPQFFHGRSVEVFSENSAAAMIPSSTVLADDVVRFRFFSQGYLYRAPNEPDVVGDLRYAMYPDSIMPLWGIRLDPSKPDAHVSFEHFRDPSQRAFKRLWLMIQGQAVAPLD